MLGLRHRLTAKALGPRLRVLQSQPRTQALTFALPPPPPRSGGESEGKSLGTRLLQSLVRPRSRCVSRFSLHPCMRA